MEMSTITSNATASNHEVFIDGTSLLNAGYDELDEVISR
jgi:hypothetical protein